MLSGYGKTIVEATECSENDVDAIEEIMRDVVFHSTLDWQTHEQFRQGARLAYAVLQEMHRASRTFALFSASNRQRSRRRPR
jgi:hypothetical protein